jgi:hypothetical protein
VERSPVRYCAACNRQREPGEYVCPPPCGSQLTVPYVDGAAEAAGERDARALAGPLSFVLVEPGDVVLVVGERSIGKSTIALQACADDPAWVSTSEMAPARVLSYARRLGVRIVGAGLLPTMTADRRAEVAASGRELAAGDWLGVPEAVAAAAVVADSITSTGDPVFALRALSAYCRERGIVGLAVSQVNDEGQARGSRMLEHEADAVVVVDAVEHYRRVRLVKSRVQPLAAALFELGSSGGAAPTFEHFYSVEGAFPDYRLVAHPAPGAAPYAAYLVELERSRRPMEPGEHATTQPADLVAPCAVAARASRLYGVAAGFVEPPDWKHRAAFAIASGVPYFSPQHGRKYATPEELDGHGQRVRSRRRSPA